MPHPNRIARITAYGLTPLKLAALLAMPVVVGCQSTSKRPAAIDAYVAGVKAYQAGDEQLAVSNLVTATEQNGNLIMAASLLGDIYKSQGEYGKAKDVYERVAKLDPYTYTSFYKLGVTYQLLDQLKDAAAAYERALVLKPDHVESNMNLGLVNLAMGQTEDAIAALKKATELDPRNPAAWANLGVTLDAVGRYSEAEKAYRTSLDLKSDQRSTLLNLGANLVRQKKTTEAISVLQETLSKGDEPFAHKQYGDALTQAGRFDDAIKEYDAAIKLNPKYVAALNEKANTLIAQYKKGLELDDDKRTAAVATWKQSLEIAADQPKVKEQIQQWEKAGL